MSTLIVNWYKPYSSVFPWMTNSGDVEDWIEVKSICFNDGFKSVDSHVFLRVYVELHAKYVEVLKLKIDDR